MSMPQNPMASPALPTPAMMLARPRLAPPAQSVSITPADIWRIIKRRMLLIIITILVVNAVGIPFNLAWQRWYSTWPGTALLRVVYPVVPEALQRRQAAGEDLIEMYQRGEAQALQARQYAQMLLEVPEIRQTDWYKKSEVDALARFERELSISPIRNTAIIRVSFRTRNPEEAPRIVNTLVEIYLADRRKSATTDLDNELISLRSQQFTLQNQLRGLNELITRLVQDEKIPIDQPIDPEVRAELGRLVMRRSDMEMMNEASKVALENMRQQNPETWIPTAEQAYRIEVDPAVRTLKAVLLDLEQIRDVQSKRLGQDHIFIQRLDDRIRVANRDLQVKLAELRLQIFTETIQAYETAVVSNERTLEQIEAVIRENLDKQNELNTKILEYRSRQEEKEALVNYSAIVENRINTTQATRDQNRSNVASQVIPLSLATRSPERASPRLKTNIAATVFLSVFIAAALAFGLELLDKSLRSSQDVRRHTELTFLGSIPALQEDEAGPADMYSVVMQAPRSLIAEAFRQIRTNLLFYCSREDARSILVTSPSPEDGRTCIAVNLSASIAMSGLKTLLIDANFCRPGLHKIFPDLPSQGFADVLMGKVSPEQVMAESSVPGLSIMSNGQTPAEHTELLGGDAIRKVIAQLTERFDQIILDGPPALLTAHALAIAGQVDGIVFVARAGKNSRGELNRMREETSRLNSHIHGVVLNGVEATRGGYLRKHYQKFYDYHYPESAPGSQMLGSGKSPPPTPPQTS